MNRWFTFLLFALCAAIRAADDLPAGRAAFDIPLASSNEGALLAHGDLAALPQPPPVFEWQTDAPVALRMVPDESTGGSCLGIGSPSLLPGQTVQVNAPLTLPRTGRALVAVEARGAGRLRIQVSEQSKGQWMGSACSSTMPLTSVWRWYFFEYTRTGRPSADAIRLHLIFQTDGAKIEVFARTVRALEATETAPLTPTDESPTRTVFPRLTAPEKLTGDLTDPVWGDATRFAGFVNNRDTPAWLPLAPHRLSTRPNEVRLFHDGQALYLGFRSVERSTVRTSSFNDSFVVALVPPAAKQIYRFLINTSGSFANDGTYDIATGAKGKWTMSPVQSAVRLEKGVFTAEVRIPAKDLGLEAIQPGEPWRLYADRLVQFPHVTGTLGTKDRLVPSAKGMQDYLDWEHFAVLEPQANPAAVDVELTGYNAAQPIFSARARGVDGRCVFSRRLVDVVSKRTLLPWQVTEGDAKLPSVLGLFLSHAKADRYRLDFQVASMEGHRILVRFSREFSTLPPLALRTDIDCVKQTVTVQADARGLPVPDGIAGQELTGLVEIEKKDDPRVLVSAPLKVEAGETASVTLPIKDLKDGVHLVDCTVRDAKGRLLAEAIEPIRLYQDQYWLNNGLGEEDMVPRPYAAPRYEEWKGLLKNWGHWIKLGRNGLPEQIWVEGVPLLAGPVELSGKVAGKEYAAAVRLKPKKDGRTSCVELEGQSEADGVRTTLRLNFDYDGMLRADVELKGAKPVSIEAMALRIPVRREIADILVNQLHPQATPTGYGTLSFGGTTFLKDLEFARDMQFVPTFAGDPVAGSAWDRKRFWGLLALMNMDRGLTWFTESDEHWSVKEGNERYGLERDAGKVVLVIRLVDTPVTVERWPFTFGLQALPVRPADRKVDQEMWRRRTQYAAAYEDPNDFATLHQPDTTMLHVTNPGAGIEPLDTPRQKRLLILDPWIVMHHAPDSAPERLIFRRTEEFWAQDGRRFCMYNNTSFTWWDSPEYRYFKALWGLESPGSFWEWEMIEVNRACPSWQDYYIYHFYQMLKRYPENYFGFDCPNIQDDIRLVNGMGYERNGKRYPTLNIFGTRRMFKRAYVIADRLRKDPLMWLHQSGNLTPMITGFCHATGGGEEWRGWQRHQFESKDRNLDFFRYDCAARLGPMRDFMMQAGYGSKERVVHAIGMCLLHNLPFTEANNDARVVWDAYAAMDRFGLGRNPDEEFHPYWKPDPRVKTAAPRLKASFWTKSGGAMVVVVNVDWDQTASENVEIDTTGLGLKQPKISVFDPMANHFTDVTVDEGTLRVKLEIPPALYRVVLLETK